MEPENWKRGSPDRISISEENEGEYKKTNNRRFKKGMTIALSEFLGTALLVFGTCMGNADGMAKGKLSHLQLSLVAGLAVTAAIQIFGHISGAHINPAITLCALITNEIKLKSVPIYVCSQIAGCLAGYALLMAVTPERHLDTPTGHCVNLVHDDISLLQGCLIEILATLIMALAVCASWDSRNSTKSDSISLRIGIIVFWLNLTAGYYTGASMNPARSFGPAACNQKWDNHWVYWVSPIIGASIAGELYKKVFLKND